MDDNKFCVVCGANLPPGSSFCPSCGSNVDGSPNSLHANQPRTSRSLGYIPTLVVLYGALAVVFGLLTAATLGTWESIWDQICDSDGLYMGYTLEKMTSACLWLGIAMVVSGACALVSYWFLRNLTNFNMALGFCVLASVTPFIYLASGELDLSPLIPMIIGLIVSYMIYKKKSAFLS